MAGMAGKLGPEHDASFPVDSGDGVWESLEALWEVGINEMRINSLVKIKMCF